jgi:hypothetical protein
MTNNVKHHPVYNSKSVFITLANSICAYGYAFSDILYSLNEKEYIQRVLEMVDYWQWLKTAIFKVTSISDLSDIIVDIVAKTDSLSCKRVRHLSMVN